MEAKNIQLNICYSCMSGMPEGSSVCPACGNDNRVRSNPENTLPEGTVLFRKYLVGKVIGRGGFGITYIGYDLDLQLKVAIKEYFPAGVSFRSSRSYDVISDTSSASQNHTAFSKGCEAFLDEARMLASVNSPYIVHVRDFFREHGTAYIVMDYVNGLTLPKAISRNGGRISAERVVSLMLPLIDQLDELHERNIIHRDIKPDNIMLVKDRKGIHPVLLDFGAARSFISSNVSKTYTAVVTPGFAPLEQYSQRSRQGAFTDVYGICATMYYAITGAIPPAATERSIDNVPVPSFRERGVSAPEHVEAAIMHGLALKSENRTQTMKQLYSELTNGNVNQSRQGATDKRAGVGNSLQKKERNIHSHLQQSQRRREKKTRNRKALLTLLFTLIIVVAGSAAYYYFGRDGRENSSPFTEYAADEMVTTESISKTDIDSSQIQELKAGDYVLFGTYEQDNVISNGQEPIQWLVLDVQDGQALLLSRYGLDCMQYSVSISEADVTWESCSLRRWLNDVFLTKAFSETELEELLTTEITADKNPNYSSDPGNNTQDKIFLLSALDTERYFSSAEERTCEGTTYCYAKGAYRNKDTGNCYWWLRTPGMNKAVVTRVSNKGSVDYSGCNYAFRNGAVRPAVWINVAAITEKSYSVEANTQGLTDVHVGDYVSFGSYDQDLNRTNGKESIDWLVLDIKDNKALLLSRYLFDSMQYWAASRGVTWETGKLRTWLNQSFLQDAFSASEQDKIITTLVTADKNPSYDTDPGNDTRDKVFLLSAKEVKELYKSALSGSQDYKAYFYPAKSSRWSFWWTRTPGYYQNFAVYVNSEGETFDFGERVDLRAGVRPAMWVDISALQK